MKKVVCDKCGKELETGDFYANKNLKVTFEKEEKLNTFEMFISKVDICKQCLSEIVLSGGRIYARYEEDCDRNSK